MTPPPWLTVVLAIILLVMQMDVLIRSHLTSQRVNERLAELDTMIERACALEKSLPSNFCLQFQPEATDGR